MTGMRFSTLATRIPSTTGHGICVDGAGGVGIRAGAGGVVEEGDGDGNGACTAPAPAIEAMTATMATAPIVPRVRRMDSIVRCGRRLRSG